MKNQRRKREGSLDTEMLKFVALFGVPFVTMLSVLGGLAAALLGAS